MSSDISFDATDVCLVDVGTYESIGVTSPGSTGAEALRTAARTQGYAAGYAAGMRAAAEQSRTQREQLRLRQEQSLAQDQEKVQAATQQLGAASQALQRRTASVVHSAEQTLLRSSLDLAEAILGAELRDGPHGARAALARVLDALDPVEVNVVRMHPSSSAQLPPETLAEAGVRVIPDPTVAPGDAVAELPDGFLDARISHALERCHAVLDAAAGES